MDAKMVTAQETAKKGIGLYGKVITECNNNKISQEMDIIADADMFGECIFCQTAEDRVRSVDILNEIQKTLKDEYLDYDERIQKYRLTELIPCKEACGILFFMRIAYISFQKSKKELDFLKAFIGLAIGNSIKESLTEDRRTEIKKGLGNEWAGKILKLYKGYFQDLGDHTYLRNLCNSLKPIFDEMDSEGDDSRYK